jgi:hypothetical protein
MSNRNTKNLFSLALLGCVFFPTLAWPALPTTLSEVAEMVSKSPQVGGCAISWKGPDDGTSGTLQISRRAPQGLKVESDFSSSVAPTGASSIRSGYRYFKSPEHGKVRFVILEGSASGYEVTRVLLFFRESDEKMIGLRLELYPKLSSFFPAIIRCGVDMDQLKSLFID